MSRDRYEKGELLGSGVSGKVYRATHKDLGRDVALKILDLHHPDQRAYLLAEGKRMAQLRPHQNIVQVFDSGDWDEEQVYLAVELCDGGSLDDLCGIGPVDPHRACRLISDACRGLHDLHLEGMLHLDVRPGNILLNDDVPKLSDFGLSRSSDSPAIGSPYGPHAAPEVHLTRLGSASADQYATAMTLGHLLTASAYCHALIPDPVTAKNWKNRPDPRTLGLHVPPRLAKVLKKATAFDPAARYEDVESFKRALDQATPAVAFLPAGERNLASTDGTIVITWGERKGDHFVDCAVKGRRKSQHGHTGPNQAGALTHIRKLVGTYAYK